MDNRPRFIGKVEHRIRKRADKIATLSEIKTPEARAERKRMNVHVYGRAKVNLNGFFHPNGRKPVRCK